MDSRIFHIAFTKALNSVAWDKHGEHEYVIIGDGVVTDQEKLQGLINSTFAAPVLWLSMGRRNSASIARSDAAREIVSRLKPKETVTVCDEDVRTFLQVLHLGIARTGVARSNYAFKRAASTQR